MKRQRSYDSTLVKLESLAGGSEPGLNSSKEGRHDSPRVKRRDGGSGPGRSGTEREPARRRDAATGHGRSGTERELAKAEEHARRRDGVSSQGRFVAERGSADGDERAGAGSAKEDSVRSRGTKEAPGSSNAEKEGQPHHGRSGRLGSPKGTFPGREEEGETNSRSSLNENESEGPKVLVTKRQDVKREAEVEVKNPAESEKSSEMEEGELEPEVEAAGIGEHDQAREFEAEEVKADQITEEAGDDGVGNLRDGERDGEEEEVPATAATEIVMDAETGNQVAESSGNGAVEAVHKVAEPQWGLKLGVEEQGDAERVELVDIQDEVTRDRERTVEVERELTLGTPGEEKFPEEEGSRRMSLTPTSATENLLKSSGNGREREREEAKEEERRNEKKQRVENGALLSLALPDTSLSLSSGDPHSRSQKQQHRAHSHPSHGHTQTHSRGFTESLSLSQSHHFHHNPSCSLTQTSLEKTEFSSGSQQRSVAKEQGSYGSWQMSHGSSQGNEAMMNSLPHDRRKPKPLYQRVLSGNNPQILQGSLGNEQLRGQGRERGSESVDNSYGSYQVPVADNGMHGAHASDARRKHKVRHGEAGEVWSSPSRSGSSRDTQPHSKGERNSSGQREKVAGGSEREFTSIGVQDIVSEPIPSMARKLQELPDSFLAGLKESLRDMLNRIEKREQFVLLQQTLAARTDLTTDILLRAHRIQLELLVAVKTGILAFLHSDIPMTHSALVEVFLQTKCRNFACQNSLPADECDCKLCAQKTGFCNSCMCVVCSKFDFDANTCRWIGCDFCLHWCHTDCGIRMSYITPGPSIRGAAGTTEMQFRCVACGHTSELYGFVKDVFCTCAPEWGRDVLARELDCVRRIFHGSTDARGQQLCSKAEQILQQLNSPQMDAALAWRSMVKFFNDGDSVGTTPPAQVTPGSKDPMKMSPTAASSKQKSTRETLERAKAALQTYDSELEEKRQEAAELQQERERKKQQIEELESIVRIKQAEAKMFAVRADEARREAEGLQRIMLAKAEKIEQEYACKLLKLGMEEAEERSRKHRDTVQVLHQAQKDFHALNLPLLSELHELLKQLDTSKRHSWK